MAARKCETNRSGVAQGVARLANIESRESRVNRRGEF